MLTPLQLFLFASLPFIAVADSLPKFDIVRVCHYEGGSKDIVEKCAADQAKARDELQSQWSQFSAVDKNVCIRQTNIDGNPGYVELLTCLEIARDIKNPPK